MISSACLSYLAGKGLWPVRSEIIAGAKKTLKTVIAILFKSYFNFLYFISIFYALQELDLLGGILNVNLFIFKQ